MKKDPPKPRSPTKKAAAAQADYSALITDAPQGVLVHSNFKPLYANAAFANLLGYADVAKVMALPILRPLFAADHWPQIENEYDNLVSRRVPSAVVRMPMCRADKQEVWVAGMQSGVDWCGTPAVQMVVFDNTAQAALEQSLLRAEQHMRAVLEILPYPLYIARRSDGRLLFVNRKACLLFERSASAMLRGTSVDFFSDPAERENLRKLFDTLNDVRDLEMKMKTSAGLEFMAEFSAIRMEYNGEPAILVALNDISERKALEAELMRQASTDPLTGIYNRRYFMAQAEQEMRRSRRFERPLSVMMLDIDHFKPINDRHGHAVGDAVLQGAVRRALESLRQSDQIARIGGEEFAVILPETNLAAATDVAERLRQHLAERPLIAGGTAISCTTSVGVAELQVDDASIDRLLHRADEALYLAKHKGRNRVEQAS